MKKYLRDNISLWPFFVALIATLFWIFFLYDGAFNRLFITSDQAGQRYYAKEDFAKAATIFDNQSLKGAAFFRAGEFKKSKSIYQNMSTKEGKYNLANAEVMLGLYDEAIKAYEVALKMDPDFKVAEENLLVAKARKILKEPENDGEQGVGKLGADKIVFDNKEAKGVDDERSAQKEVTSSDPHWLDRLQTGPRDFLKNKFYYQAEMEGRENAK